MGLRALYQSGPDEEELFRLTNPDSHPSTEEKAITQEETGRLSASTYADLQAEFDERESRRSVQDLIETIETLSPQQIAELLNYLQHGR